MRTKAKADGGVVGSDGFVEFDGDEMGLGCRRMEER